MTSGSGPQPGGSRRKPPWADDYPHWQIKPLQAETFDGVGVRLVSDEQVVTGQTGGLRASEPWYPWMLLVAEGASTWWAVYRTDYTRWANLEELGADKRLFTQPSFRVFAWKLAYQERPRPTLTIRVPGALPVVFEMSPLEGSDEVR